MTIEAVATRSLTAEGTLSRTISLGLIAMIILTGGGCTQLEVRRYPSGIVEGIPYALPKKSFLVAVEYEVKDCSYKSNKLFLDVKKTATTTQLVEPGEQFYIPYSSIRNAFKDTDVTVEAFDNSTLKSISAHVTDKTGPAITALLGGTLRLASLVASPLKPAATATDRFMREQYCNDKVIKTLDEIAALKVGTKTDEITSRIESLRENLKFKQVVKWSPTKDSTTMGSARLERTVYPEHFLNSQIWVTAAGHKALRDDYVKQAIDPNFPIEYLVTHVTIDLSRPIVSDLTFEEVIAGLVVRNPVQGLLRVCDGHCPAQESIVTGVVGAADVTVPQLGDYIVLPLKNRVFQDQKIELILSESGAIQKIGISSKATAAAAAENFNANFDQLKAFRDASEKAKDDARTMAANQSTAVANRTTEVNQALTSCFSAQKALKEAGGVPVGTCQ